MRNEKDENKYLPPQEQLVIAAKVSRLCQVTPETFDEQIHVLDTQEIVRLLDTILKPTDKRSKLGYNVSSSNSQVKAGATNAGNINARFNERKVEQFQHGTDVYRIGNYNATRHVKGRDARINLKQDNFEQLMYKMIADENLQEILTYTAIEYQTESLEVARISLMVPNITRKESGDTIQVKTVDHEKILWKKTNDLFPQRRSGKRFFNLKIKK